MTDKEPSNILEAIHAIYSQVGYVQKTGTVDFPGAKYKFAGEAEFIATLRPVMVKYRVTLRVKNTELVYNVPGHVIVKCTYNFEHVSKNGDATSIEASSMGEGKDLSKDGRAGDKAIPKALTGAFKYVLRQTFMIETGDDADNTSNEELAAAERKQEEASAKKRGDTIMKELANVKDNEDLDNFQVAYKADINAFRYGSKIEKEFYEEIIKEGARLRATFKEMAK